MNKTVRTILFVVCGLAVAAAAVFLVKKFICKK